VHDNSSEAALCAGSGWLTQVSPPSIVLYKNGDADEFGTSPSVEHTSSDWQENPKKYVSSVGARETLQSFPASWVTDTTLWEFEYLFFT
jgi:hypothetical protein